MILRHFFFFAFFVCLFAFSTNIISQVKPEMTAIEKTSKGNLSITPIIHGSVMFQFNGKVIYIDPWSRADLSGYPKADLILITHDHRDHLDQPALDMLRTPKTIVMGPAVIIDKVEGGAVLIESGDSREIDGVKIEPILAYNISRERSPGVKYHPKGEGVGYILTFGNKRVYVAGDTEATPEMKSLKNIDIAFLPMNLPYTMTPEEAAEAAKAFKPRILYPYHFGNTDLSVLEDLLKGENIEIRILPLGM